MKPLMSKVDLENFLEKEFPQVSSNFKILNTKPKKLSGVEGIQKYLKRIRKPNSFVSWAFEF